MTFTSVQNGKKHLEYWLTEFGLCQKMCHLYDTKSACFNYSIKQCDGACVGEESAESYNKKVKNLIDDLNFKSESFLIIDKGRNSKEYAFVLVINGQYEGYGFILRYLFKRDQNNFRKQLKKQTTNRDFQSIIRMQLHANEKLKIHHLDE